MDDDENNTRYLAVAKILKEQQNQYIITEDDLFFVFKLFPDIEKQIHLRPYNPQSERDKVLDDVIKIIHKKVSFPTNSGEQISCDASIRLGIIHDINTELWQAGE
jgi:hypothetical protein